MQQEIQKAVSHALDNANISAHAGERENPALWIGFSGGQDSSVLLDIIFKLGFRPNLIHIHHGLSQNSQDWADHATLISKQYGLSIDIRVLQSKPQSGESVESWARDQRYEIFSEILLNGGILLLAHHLDDQAETLLLQLLRGAGPKGLSSMADQKKLGKGIILRPLLAVPKTSIEAYANFFKISYVTDESNQNLRFKRNALRHEILPILKQHFPGCLAPLARAAKLCAQESELLAEFMEAKLAEILEPGDFLRFYFKKLSFQKASKPMQRQLLRVWLHKNLKQDLNEKHLIEIEKLFTAEHWSEAKFEMNTGVSPNKTRVEARVESRVMLTREKSCLVLTLGEASA